MLKKFPNVNINYITAPGKGFASDLEELLKMSAEPSLISRHYLNTAFIQKARELGSRTILYGVHGELGLTGYPMGAFAELFAQLKWARLWREINRHGKIKNKPIGQIVKTEVIKPFLPLFLQKRFSGQMQEIKPAKFSYFTADFAEVLKDKLKDSENLKWKLPARIVPNHRQNQVETIRIVQNKMRGHAINQEVESRSPLMDVRLLDFCLAAPIEFKIKNGYDRSLVRIGLDKILPPEIQWRTTKSPFSPDYHERYNQQLPVVKQYLNAIGPTDPIRKMIDVDKLKTTANLAVANNEQHAVAK
jgi:asparagine synthase (glutamine-hydrolysing)